MIFFENTTTTTTAKPPQHDHKFVLVPLVVILIIMVLSALVYMMAKRRRRPMDSILRQNLLGLYEFDSNEQEWESLNSHDSPNYNTQDFSHTSL